jgi:hypothetical protein
MYNYLENMIEDVKEYIRENDIDVTTIDETDLYDDLFIEDAITGNASGSYYCNSWKAKEALDGNEDLLQQTIDEFGIDMNEHWNDYEYLDVSVRCYLLADAIADALEELR